MPPLENRIRDGEIDSNKFIVRKKMVGIWK